jgi:predicted 3-demethylubiquinone-9 3-methyltransferase (glyoxalase superfamily)
MAGISTCLWLKDSAEDAARFYVSLFDNAEITKVQHGLVDNPGGGKAGDVLTVSLHLNGTPYTLLNGGPHFQLSAAASIVASCADKAELDRLWDSLLDGGESMMCGWLTDRFGVSWQVVPERLFTLMQSEDREAAARMTSVMMEMVKLDMDALEAAFNGA